MTLTEQLDLAKTIILGIGAGGTFLVGFAGLLIAKRQAEISGKQAGIANAQAETAKHKLKLDLYDRRYSIFINCYYLLKHLATKKNTCSPQFLELFKKCSGSLVDAQFLLPEETLKKLALSLLINIETMQQLIYSIPETADEERRSLVMDDISKKYSKWAGDEIPNLIATFKPELDFRNLK